MRHRVFISHCEEDFPLARDICQRIERRGTKCWIAPRDVVVGEDYARRLSDAIDGSAAFIVVLSRHTNSSHFVKAEVERAFNAKVPIFPVRIEKIDPESGLQFFISLNHRVDAFGALRGKVLDQLADVVVNKVKAGRAGGGGGGGRTGRHDLETHNMARVIGPGAMDFIAEWQRMDARGAALAWSWEAALGGAFWPFYRGMIGVGLVLAAIVAGFVLLGGALGGDDGALAGFMLGWALTALYIGLTGSVLLRRHARRHAGDDAMRGAAKLAGAGGGLGILLAGFALATLDWSSRQSPLPAAPAPTPPPVGTTSIAGTAPAPRRDAVIDPRRAEAERARSDVGLVVSGMLLEKIRADAAARAQQEEAAAQNTTLAADNMM